VFFRVKEITREVKKKFYLLPKTGGTAKINSPCESFETCGALFFCAEEKNPKKKKIRRKKKSEREKRIKGEFMNNKLIDELQQSVDDEIAKVKTGKELYAAKLSLLAKLKVVMNGMRDLPKEERPTFGKMINEFKARMEARIEAFEAVLKKKELEEKIASEQVDVTMPGRKVGEGNLHPVTMVRNQLIDIFSGMGFEVFEGPEIETDFYNFTALNTPLDHPSRDMQDTFYLSDQFLLRTQTSAGQIRVMSNKKPPIKVLSPGRVFRPDDDATHSPMFHQMEGLVVDKGITLCDLKGMLAEFAAKMFTSETKVRLRPSYFPFTEPSVEVDLSCFVCGGKGCRLCKGTGWIEVLGSGMVNRRVLENCGVDPDEYTGFAFGMGIERIAMLKYGVNNIKNFYDNDVRFLTQFKD
jgi:phenylalanyl-tRNA synthetase alpha chain